jgi:hypothetical protein
MDKLVPLISSTVAGPLGVVHLPRMWLKATLARVGALYDGWIPDYRGFNKMVLDALGINEEAFFAFMDTLPSYPQTERWVRSNAAKLDSAAITASNATILGWEKPVDAAEQVRERVGLRDSTLRLSAKLNDLDDWYTAHTWLVEHRSAKLDPVIPGISTSSAGPLGVKHLPRLWMKALLNALGALPEGYNSGCGLDAYVAGLMELDLDAAIAFIHTELPDYLTFERWVREHVKALDPASVARYNETITTRQKPEEKAAADRLEAGVPELSFRDVILCNDMVDWKLLHDQVLARRATPA